MTVLGPIQTFSRRGGPVAPPVPPGGTLVDLFFDRAARWPDRPALRHVEDGEWRTVTWAAYGDAVREVAAGLVALGIAGGDRVGILAGNRPRWHMADVGVMAAGGCPSLPTPPARQARSPTCSATPAAASASRATATSSPSCCSPGPTYPASNGS
jgi:long-subunit acyl-CoA synthetase (AMP-forming)